MASTPSAEALRTNRDNWKLGLVYYCPDDPRVVVRQLLPVGWTWNFGHRLVWLAILAAIALFPGSMLFAWWAGLRSGGLLVAAGFAGFSILVLAASRLARDPDAR